MYLVLSAAKGDNCHDRSEVQDMKPVNTCYAQVAMLMSWLFLRENMWRA